MAQPPANHTIMNGYLIFILAVLVFNYLLELTIALLNIKSLRPDLPEEFSGIYEADKYASSQEYTRATTHFSLIESSILLALTIFFIFTGGFNWVDLLLRALGYPPLTTGLLYIGCISLLSYLTNLPFTIYTTFVLEERFGFNTTSIKTFILDQIKGILLAVILGGPLMALILWFFTRFGESAWLYCWIAAVLFILVIQFIAPVLIMPLFNKFNPLAEGELKEAILKYAKAQKFTMQGIYTMDGSKRSTRLNAFFTGFGRFRRIVFFDTLMEKLTTTEIVAVLAHEMGHYAHRHILTTMLLTVLQMGMSLYILSLFLGNQQLFAAFSMEHVSVYAGLLFFGFLYSPISSLLSIALNIFSRRNEYQADHFALQTTGEAESMISALKKLSVHNLSNLTPHPLHVFLNYSHPPVLARIKALHEKAAG